MPNDDDIKVKQLLEGDKALSDVVDAATQAELQRWFQLPSFETIGEPPAPAEDPEVAEIRERRAKACAAVDPALLDLIGARRDKTETLIKNAFHVDIHIDPSIAQFDQAMADRQAQIGEPREIEISDELKDDLRDCTPQALLRDLHRPETGFDKTFEIIDVAAEQKLDIVAEVDAAMKMNLRLPPLGASPMAEQRRLMEMDRVTRRLPWIGLRRNGEG
jgi:hypothetical protein